MNITKRAETMRLYKGYRISLHLTAPDITYWRAQRIAADLRAYAKAYIDNINAGTVAGVSEPRRKTPRKKPPRVRGRAG